MNQGDKVAEILESLHDHIEGQKRIIDEENQQLLEKGKKDFRKAAFADHNTSFEFRESVHTLRAKQILSSLRRYLEFMRPTKLLERARRAHPARKAGEVLHGRSSIVGAMGWMFGLSLLLTLLLGWIPIAGPFIGPIVGGYFGGRRAGSLSRALLAALLPALLLSIMIIGLGALASALADHWLLGAAGVVFAGALGVILIIHNLLLFAAAFIGGWVRQLEGK